MNVYGQRCGRNLGSNGETLRNSFSKEESISDVLNMTVDEEQFKFAQMRTSPLQPSNSESQLDTYPKLA
jgi:hypothetical protein